MLHIYTYIVSQKTHEFIIKTYPIRGIIPFLARVIARFRRKKFLLVFGMSRSGTSMLSQFLSLNSSVYYLHEPDSELFKYRYDVPGPFSQEAFWKFINSDEQKEFKVHMMACIILLSALHSHRSIQTFCLKPITMLNVMPEISKVLMDARIIYICRHPAGRSESILRQLKHDQNITKLSNDKIKELGYDWGGTNKKVLGWFKMHPDWRWVSFEKLVSQPVAEFKQLYEKLGLAWDETIQREIEQKTTGTDGGFYEVQRDASKQADKWRESLTVEQVEAIRRGSLPFKTNLYEGF